MNLTENGIEMLRIGACCVVFTVLFFLLSKITTATNDLYAEEGLYEGQTAYMAMKADAYVLEHGESVSGNDIIEFILKHDAEFDYYFQIDDNHKHVDEEISAAKAEALLLSGDRKTVVWSEEYLYAHVFLVSDWIYDQYTVEPVRVNGETVQYIFTKINS